MTAYITTPEQHAQITEHYERLYAEIDLSEWDGKAAQLLRDTLAMLKAMKPVEHIAELMWDEEKQKSYMQYTMPIGLLLEGSKLYAGDKPPQVGLD